MALREAEPLVVYNHARIFPRIGRAHLSICEGDFEGARALGEAAVELAESDSYQPELGAALRVCAEAYAKLDDRGAAEHSFQASLRSLEAVQSPPELAQTLLAYGRFLIGERREEGVGLVQRASLLFAEIDAPGWQAEAQALLDE